MFPGQKSMLMVGSTFFNQKQISHLLAEEEYVK